MTTNKSKRSKYEGKRVSRDSSLLGLGDPSTWQEEAAALELEFQRPHDEARTDQPKTKVRKRLPSATPMSRSVSTERRLSAFVSIQMLPTSLEPRSSTQQGQPNARPKSEKSSAQPVHKKPTVRKPFNRQKKKPK